MELTPKQQTVEQLRGAQNILLLSHVNPDADALGSMLALYLVLKKLGKDVTAVSLDEIPASYQFLPSRESIIKDFCATKDFVITVDTSKTRVEKLGYKNIPEENKLNIIITPKNGLFCSDDVSISAGPAKFDLIIVLDSPDLDRLGVLYEKNTELFYETPLINIDHHSGNDHFGKINWVDLTATSTSEILVALIESLSREKQLLDADVATALLAGIIADTGSFQNANTTPKSFTVAAQLVAAGARQQEIIRHMFKTKSLSTLKLWGRILANVNAENKFVWSKISRSDFEATGAEDSATSGIIDELLKTAPGIDFALLLSEKNDGLHGSLRAAQSGVDVSQIAKLFGGGGHSAASAFHLSGQSLTQKQDEIISTIKQFQQSNSLN